MLTPHLGAELKKFGLKVSEIVEGVLTETELLNLLLRFCREG